MAKKTETPATTVAPIAAAVSAAIATPAVTLKLAAAVESATTADQFAREAATLANDSDFPNAAPVDRLEKILALYSGSLTHKAVKESFSAALVVLVADKPVRIAATEKAEKATGAIRFTAPEALSPVAAKGEILPEGKVVTELSAGDAVSKLAVGVLKQAATAAREALGVGRAKGAGPKKAEVARASFFDEFAAAWKDDALRMTLCRMIEIDGRFHIVAGPAPRAKKAD